MNFSLYLKKIRRFLAQCQGRTEPRPQRRQRKAARQRGTMPQVEALEDRLVPTGTWTELTSVPATGTMMLQPNGTVMVSDSNTTAWYKLTPNNAGSYNSGTWSQMGSMGTPRLYFGSAVLPNDDVMVYGGEYTGGSSETFVNSGEMYNPNTNTWTAVATIPSSLDSADQFGDDPLELLSNGTILAGYLAGPQTFIYNQSTNSWSAGPTKLDNDQTDEESWVKLGGTAGNILDYSLWASISSSPGYGQYLNTATNAWTETGSVPVALSDTTEYELGPGILLPNGQVFQIGANGYHGSSNTNTALYNPATNTWAAGPVIPNTETADDAPAAILPDGNVIFEADSTSTSAEYNPPSELFEYNYVSNTITQMTGLPTALTNDLNANASYVGRMLVLPSGQIMFSDGTNMWTYSETGSVNSSWAPTITNMANTGGSNYTLTGTQFNGIDEGAAYGDDANMATNYPIVQITDSLGHIYYAQSSNWTLPGDVATGSATETVQFTKPSGVAAGNFSVVVIANGIPSNVVTTAPTVSASTVGLPVNATSMTITGSGFDTNVANDTVAFDHGVTGTVTAATFSSMTVSVSGLSGLAVGTAIHANATVDGTSSGAAVQVATVVAALSVTPSSADLAANAAALTIAGVGFDATASHDSVTLSNGVTGTVTAATTTSMTISLTGLGSVTAGTALTAVVTEDGYNSGSAVQVATVAPAITANSGNVPANAPTITVTGFGFDATASHDSVSFDNGVTGTVTSATVNSLTVSVSGMSGLSVGTAIHAIVTVDSVTSGSAVQVATVAAPLTVTPSSAILFANATSLTIAGTGFDTTASHDTLTLSNGVTGTVSAATSTSLSVSLTGLGSVTADTGLTAIVTVDGYTSGSAVQVATIAPVITPSSGNVATGATVMTIAGFGFDATPSHDTLAFDNGVTGTVTAATVNSLTVTVSGLSSLSVGTAIHANITVDGISSGAAVQVATVAAGPSVNVSTANLADSSATITINGGGFSTTPASNTVTFNTLGVVGSVTSATANQLIVSISTPPTGLGSLTAEVTTNGITSGSFVQVATVVNGTWTVTSSNGSGGNLTSLTLPYAVAHVQNGDQINFASGLSGSTITPSSTLTISHNITITGLGAANLAVSGGGSVQDFIVSSGFTATITGLTIENGAENDGGGGGVLNLGTLSLSASMISGNNGDGTGTYNPYGSGGGILNLGALTLSGDTFSSNTAAYGGGLASYTGGSASITNCTFIGNTGGSGAGICDYDGGTLSLTDSTVAFNNGYGAWVTSMDNSIVGGNTSGNMYTSGGGVSTGTDCLIGNTTDLATTLAYNGGPTETLAITAGSPALGAGDPSQALTTSQNGVVRPTGGTSIGAYQTPPTLTSSVVTLPVTATSMTLAGSGFDTTAAHNTVTFDNGVTGTVTAATGTSLTVSLTGLSSVTGGTALHANVTIDGTSTGTAVQVATTAPVVTASNASLADSATSMTIAGFGFDTTAAHDTVSFDNGVTGTVTSATGTSLTVSLSGLSSVTGGTALHASATVDGTSSGSAVQVATVGPAVTVSNANLPVTSTTLTISGSGFDTTTSHDTVSFSNGVTGTVAAATSTALTISLTGLSSLTGGTALNASVTVDGASSGSAVQVATVAPVVTVNNAHLADNATSMLIAGFGFDTTASHDSVTFSNGVTGAVTSATSTTLTISLTGLTNVTGGTALSANVTVDGASSGSAVQVATIAPVVTVSNAHLADNATSMTIAGFGFDTTASHDSVTFSNGVTGTVTAATSTSLTVSLTGLSNLTADTTLTASATVDGISSGTAVQVATIAPVVTASNAHLADNAASITIAGFGFDTTASHDTVAFSNGVTGTVSSATSTSLVVSLTGLTSVTAGTALSANATVDGISSGSAVQVATVAPVVTANSAHLADNATSLTIAGLGFDTTAANDTVSLSNGVTGTVSSATGTSLIVSLTGLSSVTAGTALSASVTVDGVSSGSAVQVATIAPVVAASSAHLADNATSLTIAGFGFDTTAANDSVTLSNGVVGTVSSATSTSLIVSLTGLSGVTAGTALSANVTVDGVSSGSAVQVATVEPVVALSTANMADNATTVTIAGFGFDAVAGNNTVTLNDGAAGTVTSATATSLTVTLSTQPATAGSLTAVVTTDAVSSGSAVQVATVTPVVTSNSASLAANATTVTIDGFGFDPTAGQNTVTFNDGAAGIVTSASATSLTVTFSTQPTAAGSLTAVVTTDSISSGSAVQVATVVTAAGGPTVVSSTASLAANATTVTINGTGFDAVAGNDTITFNDGAAGTVTSATATSLTVTLSTQPATAGSLTAVVTTDSVSSGSPVQVATVTPVVDSSTAGLAANAATMTINGAGFDATAGNNLVTFNDGAAGTVTSATATSLTVTFSTQPAATGSLTAVVTTDSVGSGSPVQVATVTPVVVSSTAGMLANTPTLTINGFGFDATAGNNTVTFNDGAAGTVTSATATSLTVTFSTYPTAAGSLTAAVTTDSVSSGVPVQVATVAFVTGVAVNGDYAPIVDISSDGVSTVTVTTDGNNGFTAGSTVVISGYTGANAGYDGTFQVQSASGDTFTVANTTPGLTALTPTNGGNTGFAISQNSASSLLGVQRSMVDSVVYSFSSAVSLTPANFTLGPSAPSVSGAPALASAPATLVPGMALTSLAGGSIWVVTWVSGGGTGATVTGHSLADGVYNITLANSNEATDTFYRLYGNVAGFNGINHTASLNNQDSLTFTHSYLLSTGAALYLADVDYDANGVINNTDSLNFTHRYLSVWSGFAPTI